MSGFQKQKAIAENCCYQIFVSVDGCIEISLINWQQKDEPNFVEEQLIFLVKSLNKKLFQKIAQPIYAKLPILFEALLNNQEFKNHLATIEGKLLLNFLGKFEEILLNEFFLIESKKTFANKENILFSENVYQKNTATKLVSLLYCEELSKDELVIEIEKLLENLRVDEELFPEKKKSRLIIEHLVEMTQNEEKREELQKTLALFLQSQKKEMLRPEINAKISLEQMKVSKPKEKETQCSVPTQEQGIQSFEDEQVSAFAASLAAAAITAEETRKRQEDQQKADGIFGYPQSIKDFIREATSIEDETKRSDFVKNNFNIDRYNTEELQALRLFLDDTNRLRDFGLKLGGITTLKSRLMARSREINLQNRPR